MTPTLPVNDPDGLIVGPSHVIRWRQLVRDNGINRPTKPEAFIGLGGLPVWSDRNMRMTVAREKEVDAILYIVGDFRFGNSICTSEDKAKLFVDGHFGVKPENLNLDCDAHLYERSLQALDIWRDRFKSKIKILHWTLLGRQVFDRIQGKYIADQAYRHPSWNLSDLITDKSGSEVYDLRPLQRLPMHQVMRLFLDMDVHPTHAGYLFISHLFYDRMEPLKAFSSAINTVEAMLLDVISTPLKSKNEKIAIVGQSIWLSTLCRYLGSTGLQKLRALGVFVLPLVPQMGNERIDIAGTLKDVLPENIFIITNNMNGDEAGVVLGKTLGSDSSLQKATPIFWELNAAHLIGKRPETPLYGFDPSRHTLDQRVDIKLTDDMVEIGRRTEPTLRGLLYILNKIVKRTSP